MQINQKLTTSDSWTLHFTLWVGDNTSVVFEVKEDTITSTPWLTLTNDNSWHNWKKSQKKEGLRSKKKENEPFLRSSGLPFLTVAITISPALEAGRRLRRAPKPRTETMYKFLAPELSAQLRTAPVGRPTKRKTINKRAVKTSINKPTGHTEFVT